MAQTSKVENHGVRFHSIIIFVIFYYFSCKKVLCRLKAVFVGVFFIKGLPVIYWLLGQCFCATLVVATTTESSTSTQIM